MARNRILVLLLPLLLVLAAAPRACAGEKAPRPAPTFSLPTGHGTVALDSLRGKVVLVDFWASWCGPCHQSFPWLAAMHKKYADKGLKIVAVNVDKNAQAAAAFLLDHEAPFTVAYDPLGRTAAAYHVEGMPTSVLVGPDGKVLYTHIGFDPAKAAKLESVIQEACTR